METDLENLLSDLTSDDDVRAVAAVDALSALGKSALPALLEMRQDPDPNRRWWAIRVLSAIPDPEVPAYLQSALCDPDYTVRQCAALGLSQQPTVDSIPDLIRVLNDKDRLVARLAAIDKKALDKLLKELGKTTERARVRLIKTELEAVADKSFSPRLWAKEVHG